jgi:hypothetical protein
MRPALLQPIQLCGGKKAQADGANRSSIIALLLYSDVSYRAAAEKKRPEIRQGHRSQHTRVHYGRREASQ